MSRSVIQSHVMRLWVFAQKLMLTTLIVMAGLGPADAQIKKRSFINSSFEEPDFGTAKCWALISDRIVPGWITSHSNYGTDVTVCDPAPNPGGASGRVIEFWTNGYNNVNPLDGKQVVELNGAEASRISQEVCLIPGETVKYSFGHRARSDMPAPGETALFLLDAQPIIAFASTAQGAGTVTSQVLGRTTVGRDRQWSIYEGEFVNRSASGMSNIGFESTLTITPHYGNYLDKVELDLALLAQFPSTTLTTREGHSTNFPQLQMAGVLAAPTRVYFRIIPGSAT